MIPLETALYNAMSDVSEELYAAGWMKGAEYDIWRLVHEGGTWGMGCACDVADALAAIKALSEQIGTWIVWENHEPRAIPIEDWRLRYEAEMKMRRLKHTDWVASGGRERMRESRRLLFGEEFADGIAFGCDRCRAKESA